MRKILIITYYWPPAGGPGVQRWLKFVKYLPEFGFEPIVYIPENPNYPIVDVTLEKEVPSGIQILKHKISEPYKLAGLLSSKKTKRISSGVIQTKNQSSLEKLMLWIRGNFFIPDARKNWVKPSIDYLSAVIEEQNIDTVVTTGPPHSVHLIGDGLKNKFNLKWIADFRDPWTSIGYHKKLKLSKASQQKHKQLEKQVLNNADKIVVTSATTKTEFSALTKQPISVITNGHDTDYKGESHLDTQFTITHIGSLLTGRNPTNLWKIISEIAREDAVFRTQLQLEFLGVVSQDVMDSLHRYELEPYIKFKGYVSHAAAVRKQRSSQVLLLIEIDSEETKGIIPGKLFEYMSAQRPILAVGPNDWDAGKVIAETESGAVFDYTSNSELKDVILKWFKAFKNDSLSIASKNLDKYSRRALTEELSKLL
ncbi:glycosyltransferase family 4 protein [Aurantibacter crassamenti]|uniref:glycosyltransferase family 4 protein n=1 Tax=Aurantibacter crassamenti TaxID=1837375 RepID=UPI00193AC38A|nr:glycosyltransferase family 4 protein [Aurantibacter crassamenti]MBM1107384.1 glycosyltransferase family 4 protein [Aurantibacter crassamenti]